jgi:hypothetical protein
LEVAFAENKPPINCDSIAALDEVLDRLHAGCEPGSPILVCIDLPGHRIDIGLGVDPTVIVVNTQPCDGEYWISVGDEKAVGDANFYGCGNHQQFARRHLIPVALARSAVREFIRTGVRSPDVRWADTL